MTSFWVFLSDHIHGRPALDWARRKRIALGTARGLVYLHEQCDPKIIHRDVKAANILLDEDFEAVVGDFGLAKLLDHRESHVTTAVRGTVGHIAPEYLSTGQSSEKTDVFGYGILLLELITGQKALDFGRVANQKGVMLDWVLSLSLSLSQGILVMKFKLCPKWLVYANENHTSGVHIVLHLCILLLVVKFVLLETLMDLFRRLALYYVLESKSPLLHIC